MQVRKIGIQLILFKICYRIQDFPTYISSSIKLFQEI